MQLVIPAAAAFAGSLTGLPMGAQLGWMIGSMLMAEKSTIHTGKIGETFVATSSFGVPLARVYGTDVVSGNTTWASEKKPHTQKISSGGKGFGGGGSSVEQTYYTLDRVIKICQGPILGIRRVWDNEKLVVGTGQPLPGTLHLGTTTQGRDSYLTSVLGADVPAWRGEAYMVIQDEYLGVSGIVPNYRFEVVYGEPL